MKPLNPSSSPDCNCMVTPTCNENLSQPGRIASWICRLVAAVILLQTLYFKFTGAPESVYIFTTMGIEPWGRYVSGIAELLAAGLMLFPRTPALGALLAAGVMVGAIGSHLTKLGIVVQNDGGLLFGLALIVFLCASMVIVIHRRQIPFVGPNL
jgi:uncharacterized membrane protein YphA (DoxX/SURF4 family)